MNEIVCKTTEWKEGKALLDAGKMVYMDGNYVHMHVHRERLAPNDKEFGFEIYFYRKPDFSDGHYRSRYYKGLKGVPQKYWNHINEMLKAHEEHFGPIEMAC